MDLPYALFERLSVENLIAMFAMFWIFYNLISKKFEKVEKQFEKVEKQFEKVEKRFEKVDQRFDKIEDKLTDLDRRLCRIEGSLMNTCGLKNDQQLKKAE
jgi:septal ring factor EnvC (AmiA/AmiB activator)